MISESTRALLRQHAIRTGLGGARYQNRRPYSDSEIIEIYEKHLTYENKLQSLFGDKVFKTHSKWKNDIARHMDTDSRVKFMVLFDRPICNGCHDPIKLHNLFIKGSSYSKFCCECVDKTIWCRREFLGSHKLEERGKKITDSKIKYYQTPQGEATKKIIGHKNSIKMTEYHATEAGKRQVERSRINNSLIMKEKIRNGEFTPLITNTWTHWDAKAVVDGNTYRFRSSWEACFWICNQHLQYETMRIPYTIDGVQRTYIADFFDSETKTLYEIKPKSGFNDQIDKMTIIINYCLREGIKFIWINEDNIFDWIDESKIDAANQPQLDKLKGIKHAKTSDKKHQEN